MADTPAEGGDAATTPKRPRKGRVSTDAAQAAETPKARKPRAAKAEPRKRATPSETPSVEAVAKTVRKRAATAKPAVKRVARKVEDKAAKAGESVSRKKVALGAVALGVAAGVAAVVGRKKIAKVTTEAIDAVTGSETKGTGVPTRSAD